MTTMPATMISGVRLPGADDRRAATSPPTHGREEELAAAPIDVGDLASSSGSFTRRLPAARSSVDGQPGPLARDPVCLQNVGNFGDVPATPLSRGPRR